MSAFSGNQCFFAEDGARLFCWGRSRSFLLKTEPVFFAEDGAGLFCWKRSGSFLFMRWRRCSHRWRSRRPAATAVAKTEPVFLAEDGAGLFCWRWSRSVLLKTGPVFFDEEDHYHCVIMYGKSQGWEGNLPLRQKKDIKNFLKLLDDDKNQSICVTFGGTIHQPFLYN